MPPKIKKMQDKLVGELRRSQLLTTFGCGALVDFPRFSGIMAGLDEWNIHLLPESAKIHERNLERLLGKEFFFQVSSPETSNDKIFSLPTYRFPSWYYCPECKRLDRYKKIAKPITGNTSEYNSELVCNVCSDPRHRVKLIPSRFVVACLNGHIEDFPYDWWCHRKVGSCSNPQLKLEYKGRTGGLDSIHIKCENCGAETTMAGCMDDEALKGLKCHGSMPWLGFKDKHWYQDPESCGSPLRCLQRSANNVYYSVKQSALTIPPWSDKLQHIFASSNSLFEDIFDEETDEETKRRLTKTFNKNPKLYGGDLSSFIKAAYLRYRDVNEDIDVQSIRCDEYRAFCGLDINHEYFKTKTIDIPEIIKPYFKCIKLVKKIREVMVLQGFRRILPTKETDSETEESQESSNNEFSPLSRNTMNWLPAIEMFGEGIFLELNEEKVELWESENRERYNRMYVNHKKHEWIGNGMFAENSPRYVLLHTLSHLLIRQLTSQCGYATASIKEKIYSNIAGRDEIMCGILIYTSATDTDGSLGGLVREGYSDRISNTILNMLQVSSWCSNDPLCIDDSITQGFGGLNYAACHACTLLPETSCEAQNCLLDRGAIVGTPDNKSISYFKEIL